MRTCILRSHVTLPRPRQSSPLPKPPHLLLSTITAKRNTTSTKPIDAKNLTVTTLKKEEFLRPVSSDGGHSRFVVLGAVTFGVAMLFAGMEEHKALAFGPEGPLMEDFWDNMRRYGLYALTVSTGALYTIFQPILELLKNPISAILVLVILVGSFYIVSQVVTAMVGVSDFAYEYAY